MPRPRFTTLQLLLVTTLAALLTGLFTSAWALRPIWVMDEIQPDPGRPVIHPKTGAWTVHHSISQHDLIPINERIMNGGAFCGAFAIWAAVWGIVRKLPRQSLPKNG